MHSTHPCLVDLSLLHELTRRVPVDTDSEDLHELRLTPAVATLLVLVLLAATIYMGFILFGSGTLSRHLSLWSGFWVSPAFPDSLVCIPRISDRSSEQ